MREFGLGPDEPTRYPSGTGSHHGCVYLGAKEARQLTQPRGWR